MPFSSQSLARFCQEVYTISGKNLAQYKSLEQHLQRYLSTQPQQDLDYLLETFRQNPQHLQDFLNHLTINVSEFFRNPERFKALKQQVLPLLISQNPSLQIWSAGCSFGAEIYSLVIMMANLNYLHHSRFLATDIDTYALNQAQKGVYGIDLLKNVSRSDLNYYFELQPPQKYQLQTRLRQRVAFKHHDLLSESYPCNNHLILCRNVMIYFNRETKYQVYQKFWRALKPGGVLFVGGAEQLLDIHKMGFHLLSPYFLQKSELT